MPKRFKFSLEQTAAALRTQLSENAAQIADLQALNENLKAREAANVLCST
jgi:hypothetical protein